MNDFWSRLDPTKTFIVSVVAVAVVIVGACFAAALDTTPDPFIKITADNTGEWRAEPATIGDHVVPPGQHCQEDEVFAISQDEHGSYRVMCVSIERIRQTGK